MPAVRRNPELSFSAVRADRSSRPGIFSAVGGEGRIELQGTLSAGSPGWRLSATASRHRNMVDLYVTARQDEPPQASGLEDFDYEAVIEMPPGLYHLRLKHIYIFPGARAVPSGLRVFQRSVRVR